MDHVEEVDCIAQILAGTDVTESARRRLVEGYLALVVSIAQRYEGGHVPFLELIEQGNLGLLRAVQSVADCERDQFAAHAAKCIERAITERG